MSDERYGAFAYAYDQALGARFFRSIRGILKRILHVHRPPKQTHVDFACGSGLAVEFFEQQGFRSIGVDLSMPMLAIARRRAKRLIAGDVRTLPVRGTFGVVTCLYDSLNHLRDHAGLVAAFASARRVMAPGSVFVFDMNDPEIYPVIWGIDDPFVADGKDFHLVMATRYSAKSRTGHAEVRGWAMVGGERVEIREDHRQRAYSRAEIVGALAAAGLEPVEVSGFDPYGEGRRVKLLFVCRGQ